MDIKDYVLAQQDKAFVGIPINLPRLNNVMRCLDKGDFWIVTGQTSTFKSSFTLTELVIPSVRWILDRIKEGQPLDLKVFYFLLEENHQDLEIRILSYLFADQFGMEVSENKLHNRGESLNREELAKLDELMPLFHLIMSKLDVYDDILWGYGMYKKVEEYMDANGKSVTDPETEKLVYVPKNPDLYVMMVIDHCGDMIPSEKEKTLFQAIEELTGRYLMKMKNFYRVIPILVQQQTNVGDSIQADMKGKTIESKLSPSTADLADNKTTAKRATQIISLFNPSTYELDTYKGYKNLAPMKNNFIYLEILKNRRGPKKVGSGVWVDPVSKVFTECPGPKDVEGQMAFLAAQQIPFTKGFNFDGVKPK